MKKADQPKREQLLRTALELFAANGLAVPTAKIAAAAGVANGTLFNYFPSKQDLIDSLYLDITREITGLFLGNGAQSAETLREASFLIWRSFVAWALAHPLKQRVKSLLLNANALSPEALKQSESLLRPLKERLEAGIKHGEFIPGLSLDYLQQIKGALLAVCITEAQARSLKGKALEKHVATGFEVYWRGVAR